MQERTLAQIVENFYARGEEAAYVIRRGYRVQRWSYRKIAQTTYRLARELLERGIGSGDTVFLWGEDSPEWAVSFFSCVLIGAIVVPMDRTASLEFSRRVCRQVEAKLCICSRELSKSAPDLPSILFEDFPELLARHSLEHLPLPNLRSLDTAEIVFTSGTTADPKGVVLSHRNILANLEPLEHEIGKYLKYERIVHPLRFLNLLPLSHVFGQFLGLFIPQILGSTVIFQDTLNPMEIIRTIKREKVSVLVTVPRMLDTIREKLERDLQTQGIWGRFTKEFDAASDEHYLQRWWRFRRIHSQFGWKFWAFISGGASLGVDAEQFWSRLGFVVVQGYGLTETTSLISLNHPMKLGRGSIGKVLPGRELKLAPDGEILVRGEIIAKSYVQDREYKPVSGQDGWFHTGDIGAFDNRGNLYFKGRRKNVIVSAEGMNIYPEDLEAALRLQPEIRDCIVLGLEKSGNDEACAVLLLHGRNVSPEPVIQRANQSLAEHQRIRRWLLWPGEDFPRTSTQKPQIRPIQDFASSHFSGNPNAEAGSGMLGDLIRRITGRNTGNISKETDLARDLNLSSIERVELLSALEDRLQTDLDESMFASAGTVGDLEKMMSGPAGIRGDFQYPRWTQCAPVTWLRLLVYYLLIWPATRVIACPQIRGRKNLKNLQGPLLFICNHITQVDIGFIMAALPLRFRHRIAVAMNGEMLRDMRNPPAQAGFARRWIERLSYWLVVALFNVFPLPQKSGFRESFAFAGESVDRGWSLLVFPEGMRTRDGNLSPFRAGIGILASNLNIPVIPIRIDGLFEMKQHKRKFARPGRVRVSIGTAIRFDSETDPSGIALDLETKVKLMQVP